jgi:hypothetical protein
MHGPWYGAKQTFITESFVTGQKFKSKVLPDSVSGNWYVLK